MLLIKKSWPRFSKPQLYRNHIYAIAIVKFSNRSTQNLFNIDQGTCMDSRKLFPPTHITFPMNFKKQLLVFKKLLFPLLEMLMIVIDHNPSKAQVFIIQRHFPSSLSNFVIIIAVGSKKRQKLNFFSLDSNYSLAELPYLSIIDIKYMVINSIVSS